MSKFIFARDRKSPIIYDKSKRTLLKDNLIKDFYDDWSIKETCDSVTLESSHPLIPSNSMAHEDIYYTHECKDNEIVYFKVDVNLIRDIPFSYLGNV